MKKFLTVLLVAVLALGLAGCRNETQNRIRRSIQDYTASRMYITIFTYDGKVVFSGEVDGKVTRSGTASEGGAGGEAQGPYIFWYDDRGRYHQTDLPYLLTSYEQGAPETAP